MLGTLGHAQGPSTARGGVLTGLAATCTHPDLVVGHALSAHPQTCIPRPVSCEPAKRCFDGCFAVRLLLLTHAWAAWAEPVPDCALTPVSTTTALDPRMRPQQPARTPTDSRCTTPCACGLANQAQDPRVLGVGPARFRVVSKTLFHTSCICGACPGVSKPSWLQLPWWTLRGRHRIRDIYW